MTNEELKALAVDFANGAKSDEISSRLRMADLEQETLDRFWELAISLKRFNELGGN